MSTKQKVEKLFSDTITKSEIKHVYANGFDTYIVYNDFGKLFVVGFNSQTGQHGFGRQPLMLQEYEKAGFSTAILPDYKVLYVNVACVYSKRKELAAQNKPIFDFIDFFCGRKR